MNPFKNRPLLLFSLIFYTFILAGALLYLRFPTDDFKLFCQNKLTQLLPGTQCTIDNIGYKFPFGMEIQTIHCKDQTKNDQTLFTIDTAFIRPILTAPISQFHVAFTAYEGKHDFSILTNNSEQKFTLQNIHIAHLNIAKVPFLKTTFNRELTGFLSGDATFNFSWTNGKLMRSDGEGNITIKNGSFGLLFPILSLKKIDLKELQSDFIVKKDQLQLSKGLFDGKELKGEFAGDLTLKSPFNQSGFAFKGTLEPLPPLLKKSKFAQNMLITLKRQHNRSTLPFLLQGNVKRPRFKFDT